MSRRVYDAIKPPDMSFDDEDKKDTPTKLVALHYSYSDIFCWSAIFECRVFGETRVFMVD